MKFQILNQKGEAMPLNSIDEEVANFFGVPIHKENYASPFSFSEGELSKLSLKDRITVKQLTMAFNWYDLIGFEIASAPKGEVSPIAIYESIEKLFSFDTEKEHITALYNLLAYWEDKGYTLMSV